MEIKGNISSATFIRRDNRFIATVKIGHYLYSAHVPNTGRMRELLRLGREVMVVENIQPNRKTDYDLILVKIAGGWACIDSRIPNRLFSESFKDELFPYFQGYQNLKAEVTYRNSRFDFCLSNPEKSQRRILPAKYYLEVKSVTLVKNHQAAMFPDAPTERGTKHLEDLIMAREQGHGAGILFCVQREDADYFTPHDDNDPVFGDALRKAKAAGVDVMACLSIVDEREIYLSEPIPVVL